MNATLVQKAERLRALHYGGELLVLPNVWDPLGARILEREGYPAVATASAAVSASLGYADGERLRRDTMLEVVGRIARSVAVPVTADMEAGYAESTGELADTVRALLEAGAVGMNLEDSIVEGVERRSRDVMCERIGVVRETADRLGVPLVLNARTDSFLALPPDEALADAIDRAGAYRAAGADCVYPVGPGDESTVRALRRGIEGPINILASPSCVPFEMLESIGIERASFGPYLHRALVGRHLEIIRAIESTDRPSVVGDVAGREVIQGFLRDKPE